MSKKNPDIIFAGHHQELEALEREFPLTWAEMLSTGLGLDEWEVVERCGLTHKQKMCFWLYFFEKKSYRQIAEILGISYYAVYKNIQLAKKKLINRLTKKSI